MHGYLLTETRHTQVTRALFSWGPEVGVQQWDVYLEILAESFNFSELVLLLCDLQCKDSMTLGAGSGAPAAPFNAGHLSKHTPLRILTVGSPWFHFTVSVQWVHSVSIVLWLQTSVKWFRPLLHRSNHQQSTRTRLGVVVVCDKLVPNTSCFHTDVTVHQGYRRCHTSPGQKSRYSTKTCKSAHLRPQKMF